jgi:hypothetical protein
MEQMTRTTQPTRIPYTKAKRRLSGRNLSVEDKIRELVDVVDKHWIWQGSFENGSTPHMYSQGINGDKTRRNRSVRRLTWKLYKENPNDPSTILGDDENVVASCGDYRCIGPDHLTRIKRTSVLQRASRYANQEIMAPAPAAAGDITDTRERLTMRSLVLALGGEKAISNRYEQLRDRALEVAGPEFRVLYQEVKTLMRQWFGNTAMDRTLFKAVALDLTLTIINQRGSEANDTPQ